MNNISPVELKCDELSNDEVKNINTSIFPIVMDNLINSMLKNREIKKQKLEDELLNISKKNEIKIETAKEESLGLAILNFLKSLFGEEDIDESNDKKSDILLLNHNIKKIDHEINYLREIKKIIFSIEPTDVILIFSYVIRNNNEMGIPDYVFSEIHQNKRDKFEFYKSTIKNINKIIKKEELNEELNKDSIINVLKKSNIKKDIWIEVIKTNRTYFDMSADLKYRDVIVTYLYLLYYFDYELIDDTPKNIKNAEDRFTKIFDEINNS